MEKGNTRIFYCMYVFYLLYVRDTAIVPLFIPSLSHSTQHQSSHPLSPKMICSIVLRCIHHVVDGSNKVVRPMAYNTGPETTLHCICVDIYLSSTSIFFVPRYTTLLHRFPFIGVGMREGIRLIPLHTVFCISRVRREGVVNIV